MVANVADPRVEDALQELYTEDTDWNVILRDLSEGATSRQARRSELLEGFGEVPEDVSLRNIFPKMSAVVYRTDGAAWRPGRLEEGVGPAEVHWGPVVNEDVKLMLFITEEHEEVPWGDVRQLRNREWHLYVLHWNQERGLLYINRLNNGSDHEPLAKAVAGQGANVIKGERIFRCLHGVTRLVLTNLDLSHVINQNTRLSMHVGTDISDALPEAIRQIKKKSNLFGNGYENGGRVTTGCSQKGRIWSYRIAYDLAEWIEWGHRVGTKLVDETISTEQILRGVILPRPLTERPALVPVVIEWPDEFLLWSEDVLRIEIDGDVVPLYEAALDILDFTDVGPIRFRVTAGAKVADYRVRFRGESVEFETARGLEAFVLTNRRRRNLTDRFRRETPIIRFANGASPEHIELYELPPTSDRWPYDSDKLELLDWSGVNIRKESQTTSKHPDSVLRRVIDTILNPTYDPHFEIVFDDDGASEAADVVCVRIAGNRVLVHLYHCKLSNEATPGARGWPVRRLRTGSAQHSLAGGRRGTAQALASSGRTAAQSGCESRGFVCLAVRARGRKRGTGDTTETAAPRARVPHLRRSTRSVPSACDNFPARVACRHRSVSQVDIRHRHDYLREPIMRPAMEKNRGVEARKGRIGASAELLSNCRKRK